MAEIARVGRADDAAFIAHTILLSQRCHRPLGWFDFALAQETPQVLGFLEKIAVAKPRSWYHFSQFLIAKALTAGKAAGFSNASISFLIGNDAAERCYAKAGFSFAEEKRDPAFEALTGCPGFRRVARAI